MDRINQGEQTPAEQAAVEGLPANFPANKLDKLSRHRRESFVESQKSPAERIKHKLTNLPPKGDGEFPKAKYHPHKTHILVKDADDEAKRAPADQGWVDSPAQFPPSAVAQFSNDEKLEMFEQVVKILGVEPGENPVEALIGFRDQFNAYAQEVAAHAVQPPAPAPEPAPAPAPEPAADPKPEKPEKKGSK